MDAHEANSESEPTSVQTVGIIGLGLMGTAIATRLLRAGYSVLGFDVSPQQRQSLAKIGGTVAETATDVVSSCDTILLSLPDSTVVERVIESIAPAFCARHLIIDTTTGDPWQASLLGAKLAAHGARFLEATVAGSSAEVYEGQVIVLAGGPADAFEASRAVLGTFAKEVMHVGDWGSAARMKLVVNLVLGLNRAVLAEALTLAESLELDPQAALDVLRTSPAYSTVMDTKGAKMLARDFTPQARLSQHLKDVRLMLAAAERTGTTLPLSLLHRMLLEQLEAAGHGELDNSAVILAFRNAKTLPRP